MKVESWASLGGFELQQRLKMIVRIWFRSWKLVCSHKKSVLTYFRREISISWWHATFSLHFAIAENLSVQMVFRISNSLRSSSSLTCKRSPVRAWVEQFKSVCMFLVHPRTRLDFAGLFSCTRLKGRVSLIKQVQGNSTHPGTNSFLSHQPYTFIVTRLCMKIHGNVILHFSKTFLVVLVKVQKDN